MSNRLRYIFKEAKEEFGAEQTNGISVDLLIPKGASYKEQALEIAKEIKGLVMKAFSGVSDAEPVVEAKKKKNEEPVTDEPKPEDKPSDSDMPTADDVNPPTSNDFTASGSEPETTKEPEEEPFKRGDDWMSDKSFEEVKDYLEQHGYQPVRTSVSQGQPYEKSTGSEGHHKSTMSHWIWWKKAEDEDEKYEIIIVITDVLKDSGAVVDKPQTFVKVGPISAEIYYRGLENLIWQYGQWKKNFNPELYEPGFDNLEEPEDGEEKQ